jgi:hypothetical protein
MRRNDALHPSFWPAKRVSRFWRFVRRGARDACWQWTGSEYPTGYGRYRFRSGDRELAVYAHRAAYALTFGWIQPELEVIHRCDERACCNPAHLEAVPAGERMRRTHANRARPTKLAKLTPARVAQLRKLKQGRPEIRARDVAPRFGISVQHLHDIWRGGSWARSAVTPGQCEAVAGEYGRRCCRYAAPGARVCWQHARRART